MKDKSLDEVLAELEAAEKEYQNKLEAYLAQSEQDKDQ